MKVDVVERRKECGRAQSSQAEQQAPIFWQYKEPGLPRLFTISFAAAETSRKLLLWGTTVHD